MENGWITTIVTTIAGLAIGIISFFLKRTIGQVDRLDVCKASKDEVENLDQRVDGVIKSIDDIKTNYLTKEDFFREQAKTDRKLEKIIDILIEIKGGGKHGQS